MAETGDKTRRDTDSNVRFWLQHWDSVCLFLSLRK